MGLPYVVNSILGPLDMNEVRSFESWLQESGYDRIHFDESYLAHLAKFHGGVPAKPYFDTPSGGGHAVVRFLNFLPSSSDNLQKEYSVETTWSMLSDRMGAFLIPFAELFNGDMLCFDFEHEGRPRVVVWYHEDSRPGIRPATENVASDFDEFLSMLGDKPNGR